MTLQYHIISLLLKCHIRYNIRISIKSTTLVKQFTSTGGAGLNCKQIQKKTDAHWSNQYMKYNHKTEIKRKWQFYKLSCKSVFA